MLARENVTFYCLFCRVKNTEAVIMVRDTRMVTAIVTINNNNIVVVVIALPIIVYRLNKVIEGGAAAKSLFI